MSDLTDATVLRLEGPRYPDGSGPKVTLTYEDDCLSGQPGVRIASFGDEDVVVFMSEVPWLIGALRLAIVVNGPPPEGEE